MGSAGVSQGQDGAPWAAQMRDMSVRSTSLLRAPLRLLSRGSSYCVVLGPAPHHQCTGGQTGNASSTRPHQRPSSFVPQWYVPDILWYVRSSLCLATRLLAIRPKQPPPPPLTPGSSRLLGVLARVLLSAAHALAS